MEYFILPFILNFNYFIQTKIWLWHLKFQPIIIIIIIIIVVIEPTHSKIIMGNTVEIEPQPVALDFKNLSQYSSRLLLLFFLHFV